jgi:hypothetical protein
VNFGFLTLLCCVDDVLTSHGDNDYQIRHLGKEAMLRNGTLPKYIDPSDEALEVYDMMEGGVV